MGIQDEDRIRARSPAELKKLGFVQAANGNWTKDVEYAKESHEKAKAERERKKQANNNRRNGKQDFGD